MTPPLEGQLAEEPMGLDPMKLRWEKILKIWDFAGINNIEVIQDPILQNFDSCSYAGISVHIDCNLRISYAEMLDMPLARGNLIDYNKWEKEVLEFASMKERRVGLLLKDALHNGVPLVNGLRLKVDAMYYFSKLSEHLMRDILAKKTLLVVFEAREDYCCDGTKPYMGRMPILKDEDHQLAYHAAALVGEYKDDALFEDWEEKEALWIYQNSEGNPNSFLGRSLNVIRHGLIVQIFYVDIYPAGELLGELEADQVKAKRLENRVEPEVLKNLEGQMYRRISPAPIYI